MKEYNASEQNHRASHLSIHISIYPSIHLSGSLLCLCVQQWRVFMETYRKLLDHAKSRHREAIWKPGNVPTEEDRKEPPSLRQVAVAGGHLVGQVEEGRSTGGGKGDVVS